MRQSSITTTFHNARGACVQIPTTMRRELVIVPLDVGVVLGNCILGRLVGVRDQNAHKVAHYSKRRRNFVVSSSSCVCMLY